MAKELDGSENFNILCSKITKFLYGRPQNERDLIKKTLDELNNIDYRYPIVGNHSKAVLLLNSFCSLIPPEDVELATRCCYLIHSLIVKQHITIEGRTQSMLISWCLQALQEKSSDFEVLIALESLLQLNVKHELMVEVLRNTRIMRIVESNDNLETTLLALQCLEICTSPPEDIKKQTVNPAAEFLACFNVFIKHLQHHNQQSKKLVDLKIVIVCLRGLQNIVVQQPDLLQPNLGTVLGIIKTYMLYGMKGFEFTVPQKLMPLTMSIPDHITVMPRENKAGKLLRHRKHRTRATQTPRIDDLGHRPNEHIPSDSSYKNINWENTKPATNTANRLVTSESDFSDTEGGNLAKANNVSGRVRQASHNLFFNVIKSTEKNVMFSYWTSFVPENMVSAKHNLFTCILRETSTRSKMAALNVLLSLLMTSKLYLVQAEQSDHMAFTPFSVTIALTLRELHQCLSLALHENSSLVLIQVLKCLGALVQVTPYHKMSPGLFAKLIRNVKPFIFHKDPDVKVFALMVLGCALASEPIIPEAIEAFTRQAFNRQRNAEVIESSEVSNLHAQSMNASNTPAVELSKSEGEDFEFVDFSSDEETCDTSDPTDLPWLVDHCINVVKTGNVGQTLIKVECLHILSAMSRNYFELLVVPYLGVITQAIEGALYEKNPDFQLHAGRTVDCIGQAMGQYVKNDGGKTLSMGACVEFWQVLLGGSLTGLLQNEHHPSLRAIGSDCIGSIGPNIFELLPRDKHMLCVTLLFACSRDEENSVKAAAVRALAICVLYPSLREDIGFVIDTAEAILRILLDPNFTVRMRASWSLGNLSDALVIDRTIPHLMEEVPDNLLLKLFKMSNKAALDKSDKIRVNIVRALGNFLQVMTEDLLKTPEFRAATLEGLAILVKNCVTGNNMKVKWNACYAIGNAMKNPEIFTLRAEWQQEAFSALMGLVVNCQNFKVRINAGVALMAPSKRQYYEDFYKETWTALLKALETSQYMDDLSEYKHKDHLVEQICLSIAHLIKLLSKEDLIALQDTIGFHSDSLRLQMRRVWERLLPEKSTVLFEANSYIASLKSDASLNMSQKEVVEYLRSIMQDI